ncbi:hypothetical protein FJT64_002905 [Amphibalanus amphitrite]|uniref:Uncharacterized protein n=1 Tax=Amphibalanus amphitrite TaxID=1232801 RepID=A0A6A4WH58_AMPAM|nr:uncharacterized protein LOC122379321 isoform X3 [Amphibalanus amphitrite]KAF0303174.1 hypothetical protein FJT64_002905 [Amphibalanus amphitrite]
MTPLHRMPPLRPVRSLEELTSDWLADQLWQLGADGRPPEPALALCSHLQRHLAPPLQRQLAQRLERRCGSRPAGPLLAALGYLLGGRRLQLRLQDLGAVSQLSTGAPPPSGGPRALAVRSENPLWDEQEVAEHAPALARVLTDFTQLVSLELTNHCTNTVLAVVGRCCRRLVKLHVELSMADNEGVRLLLGLPDSMEQCLQMCRRGTPLSPTQMDTLREVCFESTMVGTHGYILLLQALPKMHVCRVTEVDIADVIDGIYGADPSTWRPMVPCYSLRRLECRYQLQAQHAECLARCCRHLQHLCLRGRHSARNDLMMLHWFTSLSDLTSLELIDVHPAALLEFLDIAGRRLSSLHLVETSRASASLFSDQARHLFPSLRLCLGLSSLRLTLAADVTPVSPPPTQRALPSLVRLGIEGARAPEVTRLLSASAPRLQELELEGLAGGLTDEAVQSVLADGGLRELRRLQLTDCEMTEAGVESLLTECPLLHCISGLGEGLATQLRCRASENNWNLDLS